MEAQLAQQGIPLAQYLQMMGKTTEAFREEVKPYASKQAKLEVILDEIIKAEHITVSEEEMNEQYELISQKYQQPIDVVKQVLPAVQLKSDLLRMKASQLILDTAEIIEENK